MSGGASQPDSPVLAGPVLVVGAGIMGAGIAQVAAQAGHVVLLHDSREGAAEQARDKLAATLKGLVAKGKLAADQAQAALSRIQPVGTLEQGRDAVLVVEAIIENLELKRSLFRQLEEVVSADCILATNTSSISVTAMANGLKHPARLVGMHFFNPVPLMKLVEVVSGLHTHLSVADAVFALSKAWGKVPVHARSTPGFIVNRIARPYYAESLALLLERAATPEVLDACLRGAGFRMGPCELMDLIGHDTNFAVTQSVYEANFMDKRFVPSLVQRELVEGGLLGRKTGRGFYHYPQGALALPASHSGEAALVADDTVLLRGRSKWVLAWADAAQRAGLAYTQDLQDPGEGLSIGSRHLVFTDGRTALQCAREMGSTDVVVMDRPLSTQVVQSSIAFAVAPACSAAWIVQAQSWMAALGHAPQQVGDAPGLVVARTAAMLINEAADAVQQGVCSTDGADAAMKLGVNYPAGPFEWLAQWSVEGVIRVLTALDRHYRGERYRVSPWLQMRA